MQDRYVGYIGDFVKYALLRVVTGESKLGVAWYLHPNESASADGRHTEYLALPAEWRCLDEDLFDGLKKIVESTRRSVTAVEASKVLPDVVFADKRLDIAKVPVSCRSSWRRIWFEGSGGASTVAMWSSRIPTTACYRIAASSQPSRGAPRAFPSRKYGTCRRGDRWSFTITTPDARAGTERRSPTGRADCPAGSMRTTGDAGAIVRSSW